MQVSTRSLSDNFYATAELSFRNSSPTKGQKETSSKMKYYLKKPLFLVNESYMISSAKESHRAMHRAR